MKFAIYETRCYIVEADDKTEALDAFYQMPPHEQTGAEVFDASAARAEPIED